MEERTHYDLFSGLGGFALAAHAAGVRTVQFVEIDARCRAFLAKAWPGVPIHDDARTLDADRGAWLLTAGVPCQPVSVAGKRRGAADDRWLWPDTLRIVAAVRPAWALLENPPGIGGMGLDGVLAALEDQAYQVRVLSIPACAVNAPHRRERFYIVAHRNGAGCQGPEPGEGRSDGAAHGLRSEHRQGNVADDPQSGRVRAPEHENRGAHHEGGRRSDPADNHEGVSVGDPERASRGGRWGRDGGEARSCCRDDRPNPWSNAVWLSCADGKFRRAPDNSFGLVDGLHRSVLGALGNSIVPQIAERIIRAMIAAEEEE